jgi:hypothetical protein
LEGENVARIYGIIYEHGVTMDWEIPLLVTQMISSWMMRRFLRIFHDAARRE